MIKVIGIQGSEEGKIIGIGDKLFAFAPKNTVITI